jgi:hypothetical protein
MSQQNFQQQQQYFFSNQSAGSIDEYPNFGYNVHTEQEEAEAAKVIKLMRYCSSCDISLLSMQTKEKLEMKCFIYFDTSSR